MLESEQERTGDESRVIGSQSGLETSLGEAVEELLVELSELGDDALVL